MIRNKYFLTGLIAIVTFSALIIYRNNHGELYVSCTAHQIIERKTSYKNDMLNVFMILNINKEGRAYIKYQGFYINDNNVKTIVNRRLTYSYVQQRDKSFFELTLNNDTTEIDDNTQDENFYSISEIHPGKTIIGIHSSGDKVLIVGNTFQPRFVCVKI